MPQPNLDHFWRQRRNRALKPQGTSIETGIQMVLSIQHCSIIISITKSWKIRPKEVNNIEQCRSLVRFPINWRLYDRLGTCQIDFETKVRFNWTIPWPAMEENGPSTTLIIHFPKQVEYVENNVEKLHKLLCTWINDPGIWTTTFRKRVLGQNGLLLKLNIKSGLLPKLMFKIAPINPHKHKTHFFRLFLFTFPVSHPMLCSLCNFFLQNPSPISGPLWERHCWSYKASRLRLVPIFFLACFI